MELNQIKFGRLNRLKV